MEGRSPFSQKRLKVRILSNLLEIDIKCHERKTSEQSQRFCRNSTSMITDYLPRPCNLKLFSGIKKNIHSQISTIFASNFTTMYELSFQICPTFQFGLTTCDRSSQLAIIRQSYLIGEYTD